MKRPWLALDMHFIDDERVVHLADTYGPSAIATLIALLCLTKQSGQDGKVEVGYGSLARKACCDNSATVRDIIATADEIGLVEANEVSGRVSVKFPRWKRYQRDPYRAERSVAPVSQNSRTTVAKSCPTDTDTEEPSASSADIGKVFDAWVAATGRDQKRTKLTNARRDLIRRRLKDYPVEDLVDAAKGIGASVWHRGANERGKRYDSLELCLRSAEHIERFRDEGRGEASPAQSAGNAWL